MDYAGVDAGTGEQAEEAPTSEEERWWLGAQYSLVREVPDQPSMLVPVPPVDWGLRARRDPPRALGSIRLLTVDWDQSNRSAVDWGQTSRPPVHTSNSFLALAEIDDTEAWPLPRRPGDAQCGHNC